MQSTGPSKPVRRTSRTQTVVAPLTAIQTRRLENLFEYKNKKRHFRL